MITDPEESRLAAKLVHTKAFLMLPLKVQIAIKDEMMKVESLSQLSYPAKKALVVCKRELQI